MIKEKLMVGRETYVSKKDNQEHFSYFVKGIVRGKEVKVRIVPPDFGGYNVLEIVFGSDDYAELTVKPFEIKDEKGKVIMQGNMYGVKSVDEDGKIYECKIKPFQESDKALLSKLLN